MAALRRAWPLILVWAVVLGVIFSLIADWGEWDQIVVNMAWRVLISALGGLGGLVLNYFGGHSVGMATQVIESMGITRFGEDRFRKIENSFVFVGALFGAIIGAIFIR